MKKVLLDSHNIQKQWHFGGSQRSSSKEVPVWGIYNGDILYTKVFGSSQMANLALKYFRQPESSLKGWDKLVFKYKTVSSISKNIVDINNINKLCKKYKIKKYTINPDGSIDVDGNVDMGFQHLTKLPLKFNKVSGDFVVGNNQLSTFEGCPNEIGGDFDFFSNRATSLEGCPQIVGGNFAVGYNYSIKTLIGAPKVIHGSFNCVATGLMTLQGCPQIANYLWASHNSKLPKIISEELLKCDSETINTFVKYQDHYDVWENGFNEDNYRELMAEIEEGLE